MSVEDIITIIALSCLLISVFVIFIFAVIRFIFPMFFFDYHKSVREAYDTFLVFKKVLIRECCINNTAGELLDELDDKLFALYKEVK